MDRGAWWATVHGLAKSWTRLKRLSTHVRLQSPKRKATWLSDLGETSPPWSSSCPLSWQRVLRLALPRVRTSHEPPPRCLRLRGSQGKVGASRSPPLLGWELVGTGTPGGRGDGREARTPVGGRAGSGGGAGGGTCPESSGHSTSGDPILLSPLPMPPISRVWEVNPIRPHEQALSSPYQIPNPSGLRETEEGVPELEGLPTQKAFSKSSGGRDGGEGERRDRAEHPPPTRWDCQDLRCSWRGPPTPLGEPVTPSPQNLALPGLGGLRTLGSSHRSLECEWGAGVGGRENARLVGWGQPGAAWKERMGTLCHFWGNS